MNEYFELLKILLLTLFIFNAVLQWHESEFYITNISYYLNLEELSEVKKLLMKLGYTYIFLKYYYYYPLLHKLNILSSKQNSEKFNKLNVFAWNKIASVDALHFASLELRSPEIFWDYLSTYLVTFSPHSFTHKKFTD